jgi:drug/metabolite transporter (DMT)-like permease
MKSIPRAMDVQDWGLLVFLSILWGGSFMFVGIAVKELSPLLIVLCRVVIAALVLMPFHWLLQGPLPRDRQSWIGFAGMSITNNVVPFLLFATGQSMITSGLASVINATTPLFAFTILALAGHEMFSLRKIIGVVVGLFGVVVLKGVNLFAGGSETLGIFLCLLAAVSYGFGSLWAKQRLMNTPPMTTSTGQLICSSVFVVILVLLFGEPAALANVSTTGWSALFGLALFSTALAYIVFFRLITHAGAGNAQLVTMLIPVSAILMGYVVLAEAVEPLEIAGALIIIGALAIIDGRVLELFRKRQNAA